MKTFHEFIWQASPLDACTLRKRLLQDTTCLAIRDVDFEINTSILFPNEYIEQRLGLISLTNTSSILISKENDECDSASSMIVHLHVKNDDIKGSHRMVISGDIACPSGCGIVYPDQPIILLGPGEELKFVGRVYLRKASDCVYHQSCTVVHFSQMQSMSFRRPVFETEGILSDFKEPGLFVAKSNGIVERTTKPFFGVVPAKWNAVIKTKMLQSIKFCIETDGSITPKEALRQVRKVKK